MVRVRIATACLLLVNINVINAVTHAVTPSMTGPQVSGVFSAVSDGDVIEFAAGMYNTACGLNVSSAQVTIAGAGSLQTVLNCTEAESRHFEISGMGVVLRDLHLTGGFSQCVPSSPTCGDCQCGQSTPDGGNGGCVLVTASAATFRDIVISKCSTTWHGGGVSVASNSHLDLDGVSVSECVAADHGGAVYVGASSNLSVHGNSTIADNTAGGNGGAFCTDGGSLLMKGGVKLSRNIAANGGAVAAYLVKFLSSSPSLGCAARSSRRACSCPRLWWRCPMELCWKRTSAMAAEEQ